MEIVKFRDVKVGDRIYGGAGTALEVVEVVTGQHMVAIKTLTPKGATTVRQGLTDFEVAIERGTSSQVTLYESNSGTLYIQRGDGPVWDLGVLDEDDATGGFAGAAASWVAGLWEPNENDGQTETTTDGLTPVATWEPGRGVVLLVNPEHLGFAQANYIGQDVLRAAVGTMTERALLRRAAETQHDN